jgi:hypothetical protein
MTLPKELCVSTFGRYTHLLLHNITKLEYSSPPTNSVCQMKCILIFVIFSREEIFQRYHFPCQYTSNLYGVPPIAPLVIYKKFG